MALRAAAPPMSETAVPAPEGCVREALAVMGHSRP